MTQATKLPTPREAREAAGLTITGLAAKVPCAPSWVYRCEAANIYPVRTKKRAAYLAALGLTDAVKP